MQARPIASPTKSATMKADAEEGGSPKSLATSGAADEKPASGEKGNAQDEDGNESKEREMDIYSEAVIACKDPPLTHPST